MGRLINGRGLQTTRRTLPQTLRPTLVKVRRAQRESATVEEVQLRF